MDLESWSYLWDRKNYAYRLFRPTHDTNERLDKCLIMDLWTGTIRLIEDDALARALMERLSAEGIPIIGPGERTTPRTESPLQTLLEDFHTGRITMEECNDRREAIGNDPEARRAWIRENGLDC
jgi:hypothetical protein